MRRVIAAALILFASEAWADDAIKRAAALCSTMEVMPMRLYCFDQIFPKQTENSETDADADGDGAKSADAVVGNPASVWRFKELRSPIDGSIIVTASLAPISVSYSGVGDASFVLALLCRANTTSAILSTSIYMADDAASVTVRLDDQASVEQQWSVSGTYESVGLWTGKTAIPFIRTLVGSRKLKIDIRDRQRLSGEFDISNMREAAEKIARACNWLDKL